MMGDTNAAVYRRAKTGLSQGENGFSAGRKRLVARARNRLSGFTASLPLMVGRRKCAVSGRCGACHHYASAIALVVGRAFARPVGIAGRTMRSPMLILGLVLRDASLRDAPQDEVFETPRQARLLRTVG